MKGEKNMKRYKGYLVDLDGTMYKGKIRIEGAAEFVEHLEGKGLPFLYLTNNSSKTADQIADKLNHMGVRAKPEQVYTSSLATAEYISSEKPEARVFAIGEEGLFDALEKKGLKLVKERADFVVMGIDHDISYEKLARACLEVRAGAALVSTNGDIAIPTERGLVPGNGALTSVISVSTGVSPIFVGKPEPLIMSRALKRLGYEKEEVLMVGDNYNTDIKAGMTAGLDTLMVETGLSTFEEIKHYDHQPTYKYKDLHEWMRR
ncbi:putative hydrolase YutF [Halobacillus karajensis]|uniref:Acid sugar phosphatase n=2 Tax=Halobacillus karajensis TaxID=195088 RepID=A0A024P944_9BACI|nr:putative hydrolase YutF [Halobacillus karajensis]CDQ25639.1 putative hydrolase YutF [Halobacillus karajensis]CDQ25910.1 putative hydrolase YutF [Halobacillus karajensis]